MNNEAKDALSRWWWPGQWLRIVYSVWFDQLWYWKTVRPRLHGRTRGWGLAVQSSLGALFVALALTLGLTWTLETWGIQVNLKRLGAGAVAGVVFIVIACILEGVILGVKYAVPGGAVIMIFSMSLGWALIGVDWGLILSDVMGLGKDLGAIATILMADMICGVIIGLVIAVAEGSLDLSGVLLGVLIGFFVLGEKENMVVKSAGAAIVGLGLYLSGRWVTRQIPDRETRKRLANPKAPLSGI